MFAGLVLVLLGWCLLATLCLGVGRLWIGPAPAPLPTVFWTGLAVLLVGLQLWHLLLPVDGRAAALALVAAGVGLWRGRPGWAAGVEAARRSWPLLVMVAGLAALLAPVAAGPPGNADSGVYHLQAVRWAQASPVLPGLVNVHPFLGVNHGFFLFLALGDVGPFRGQVQHFANSLLILVLFAQALRGWTRLRGAPLQARSVFDAVMLAPAAYLAVGMDVASFSSDAAEIALTAALMSELLALASDPRPASGPPLQRRALGVLLLAAALGVVKLSSAGAILGACAAVAVLIWSRERPAFARFARRGAALLAVAGAAWAAQVLIRSGHLPYPGSLVSLSTDWAALPQLEAQVRAYTVAYSRGSVASDSSWVLPWLRRVFWHGPWMQVPLLLAVAAGVARALTRLGQRGGWEAWLALPPLMQLGFWFLTAPDERYLGAWHWALAGTLIASAVLGLEGRMRTRALVAALGIVAATAVALLSSFQPRRPAALQPPPSPPFTWRETQAGLRVAVPEGDACWDTPLPCASPFEPWLKAREGGGFQLAPPDREGYRPAAMSRVGGPTR